MKTQRDFAKVADWCTPAASPGHLGALPLLVQPRFSRFLDQHRNVRVVASVDRDWLACVEQGHFPLSRRASTSRATSTPCNGAAPRDAAAGLAPRRPHLGPCTNCL